MVSLTITILVHNHGDSWIFPWSTTLTQDGRQALHIQRIFLPLEILNGSYITIYKTMSNRLSIKVKRKDNGIGIKMKAIDIDDFVIALTEIFESVLCNPMTKSYGNHSSTCHIYKSFISTSALPLKREKELVGLESPDMFIDYMAIRVVNEDDSGNNPIDRIARLGMLW